MFQEVGGKKWSGMNRKGRHYRYSVGESSSWLRAKHTQLLFWRTRGSIKEREPLIALGCQQRALNFRVRGAPPQDTTTETWIAYDNWNECSAVVWIRSGSCSTTLGDTGVNFFWEHVTLVFFVLFYVFVYLGGINASDINCMPGGVIIGDSRRCCWVPCYIRVASIECYWFPSFVDPTEAP